jgi:hypothetical protein
MARAASTLAFRIVAALNSIDVCTGLRRAALSSLRQANGPGAL